MANQGPNRWWLAAAGLAVILIVAAVYGSFLGARLSGPDRGSVYRPLVRHRISEIHCYDTGTTACEQETPAFSKEFTVGYLLADRSQGTRALYFCVDQNQGRSLATVDRAECDGMPQVTQLGFLFTDSNVEVATPLYRCQRADSGDTLLTDDGSECVLAGYNDPERLGYVAGAGFLSQRRLNELCDVTEQTCLDPTRQALPVCTALQEFCKGPI